MLRRLLTRLRPPKTPPLAKTLDTLIGDEAEAMRGCAKRLRLLEPLTISVAHGALVGAAAAHAEHAAGLCDKAIKGETCDV